MLESTGAVQGLAKSSKTEPLVTNGTGRLHKLDERKHWTVHQTPLRKKTFFSWTAPKNL